MRTPRNKLNHLVGDDNASAAAYIEERQAIFGSVPRISIIPTNIPGMRTSSPMYSSPLRVKQTAYVDVKNMPIDVAADLWGVRFGNEWVDHEDVQKDELMAAIAQRLLNENLVKKQVMSNNLRTKYKLSLVGWREE